VKYNRGMVAVDGGLCACNPAQQASLTGLDCMVQRNGSRGVISGRVPLLSFIMSPGSPLDCQAVRRGQSEF